MKSINLSIIEFVKKSIFENKSINKFYLKNSPNSKYSLDDILNGIFIF